MKHFLITRFNDYFPSFDAPSHTTNENPNKGIENDWLEKRLKIFKTITVPSIKCQTDKDFIWIIKCHPKTPDWAKLLLKDDCFIPSYDEIVKSHQVNTQASTTFAKIIRKITNDKEIITTRIDSDDAISKNHISLVKKYIKPNLFFDFSMGIVKNHNGIFVHYKPKVSQFCSYLDHNNELLTVYHRFHIDIKKEECIKNQVDFGWMQHNHDTNITNGMIKDPNHNQTRNKEYPHKATKSDWDTLKLNYPFIEKKWFNFNDQKMFL